MLISFNLPDDMKLVHLEQENPGWWVSLRLRGDNSGYLQQRMGVELQPTVDACAEAVRAGTTRPAPKRLSGLTLDLTRLRRPK